ncbi:MAG: glycosyltransferase family 4 protein [Candidatus Auribacterota bacterium]|nr:glycosyltransferase family 4 protein [Candidatus Auribacterota bacterium]
MIKLAYVVKYYRPMPRISGILRFVIDLIGELDSEFEVRVFTYRYSSEVPVFERHGEHEIIRLSPPFPLRAGRAVRKWNPDVIIFGSGFWRPYYLLPYWELFRLGLAGCLRPVILTQYTNMTEKYSGLLRGLAPAPDAVVTTTEPLRQQWERHYPGRVLYIPPGLPIKQEGSGPAPRIKSPSPFRIGYFGHLQPHKGPDILLRVFQKINPDNADLLIHGVGEMEEELKETAKGWENITIQGYIPDIDPVLRSCKLLVLPYRSSVSVLGYSRAVQDALVEGIPVIGTPSPALEPLIENGVNGFICRDEKELEEKIQLLIDNPETWERLSIHAAESSKKFDIKLIAHQYRDLIKSVKE